MDKRDMGMAFGNAVKVVGDLYSNKVLSFLDPDDWHEELINDVTQLTRVIVKAQEDLGNELGLPEATSNKRSNTSPKRASGGSTSTSGTGNDPDAYPYVPSDDPATDGQVKFIKSLLDERGLAYASFAPLLNKENAKRAIYRMVNKGAESETEIFDGIL